MSHDHQISSENAYEDHAVDKAFLGMKFANGQIESDDSIANATIASQSINLAHQKSQLDQITPVTKSNYY